MKPRTLQKGVESGAEISFSPEESEAIGEYTLAALMLGNTPEVQYCLKETRYEFVQYQVQFSLCLKAFNEKMPDQDKIFAETIEAYTRLWKKRAQAWMEVNREDA